MALGSHDNPHACHLAPHDATAGSRPRGRIPVRLGGGTQSAAFGQGGLNAAPSRNPPWMGQAGTRKGYPMQTSEVLNRAADLIEKRGWVKGDGWITGESPDGAPVCLEGGIQAAAGIRLPRLEGGCYDWDVLTACPAYKAVASYLETDDALFWWNDAHERTAPEVIELLRACAVIEASREQEPAEVSA